MPNGSTKHKLAFKEKLRTMGNLTRYHAADLSSLLDRINRNSIGLDEYFDRVFKQHETTSNYPPYNLVQVSNVESRLELALAGFKKEEVNVYTEYGKLFVDGKKKTEKPKQHMSIEEWISDLSLDHGPSVTRRKLDQLNFEDGLLIITLGKVVPDHHARKDYL